MAEDMTWAIEQSESRLADRGKRWAKARKTERDWADATYSAIRDTHDLGVSEVRIAELARVDRMTVRRALGKL